MVVSHPHAGRFDYYGFANDVGFTTQTDRLVDLILKPEQSRNALVKFGVFGTTVVSDIRRYRDIGSKSRQSVLVLLSHFRFDDAFETRTGNGHVGTVRIHLAVLKV